MDFLGAATYSPEDNKLRMYPEYRLDKEDYDRVKAAGFRWAGKQELFVAPKWTPGREDFLIEICGEVGDENTSMMERAEERADRFDNYSEKRLQDANNAKDGVKAIADNIPMGQPILVGHHSQKHAQKDADKITRGMERAVSLWRTSEYWEDRAKGVMGNAEYKAKPTVRAGRIKKLESERRGHDRDIKKAELIRDTWSKENLTLEQGIYFAGRSLSYSSREHWCFYSALQDGKITLEYAVKGNIKCAEGVLRNANRWIEHLDLRLTYERTLLDASGYVAPKKVKSLKQTLKLINYKAETITYVNRYSGEDITVGQFEMTKEKYSKVHKDYKGTNVIDNSHKVRMVSGRQVGIDSWGYVAVFLTDSKIHEKPEPADNKEKVLPPPPPPLPKPRVQEPEKPGKAEFEQLQESLKTGVKVVTAPQLFQTPREIAEKMVDYAAILDGDNILEPSAGTGRLTDEIKSRGKSIALSAIEINVQLANGLRESGLSVLNADFLDVHGSIYDKIIMNPPFKNGVDIEHIKHAVEMLSPGGRVVALCVNGPRQQKYFGSIADQYEALPSGSFKESGTNVNVALVVITKKELF